MIEKNHPKLSLRKQCELLKLNCNRLALPKSKVSEEDEKIMKVLDAPSTLSGLFSDSTNCGKNSLIMAGRLAVNLFAV